MQQPREPDALEPTHDLAEELVGGERLVDARRDALLERRGVERDEGGVGEGAAPERLEREVQGVAAAARIGADVDLLERAELEAVPRERPERALRLVLDQPRAAAHRRVDGRPARVLERLDGDRRAHPRRRVRLLERPRHDVAQRGGRHQRLAVALARVARDELPARGAPVRELRAGEREPRLGRGLGHARLLLAPHRQERARRARGRPVLAVEARHPQRVEAQPVALEPAEDADRQIRRLGLEHPLAGEPLQRGERLGERDRRALLERPQVVERAVQRLHRLVLLALEPLPRPAPGAERRPEPIGPLGDRRAPPAPERRGAPLERAQRAAETAALLEPPHELRQRQRAHAPLPEPPLEALARAALLVRVAQVGRGAGGPTARGSAASPR